MATQATALPRDPDAFMAARGDTARNPDAFMGDRDPDAFMAHKSPRVEQFPSGYAPPAGLPKAGMLPQNLPQTGKRDYSFQPTAFNPIGAGRNLVQGVAGFGDALNEAYNTGDKVVAAHPSLYALGPGAPMAIGLASQLPDLGRQEDQLRLDTVKAAKEGRYLDAARHGVGYLANAVAPGAGAMLDEAGNQAEQGYVSEGVGTTGAVAAAAMAPKIAEGAGRATSALARGGERVATETLGKTTGSGATSVRRALERPTPELMEQMRGGNAEELLNNARGALHKMADARSADYTQRMAQMPEWNTAQLNPQPVHDTLASYLQKFNITETPQGLDFSRSTLSDPGAQGTVNSLYADIKGWGSRPGDLTPKGMDVLKRRVSNLYTPNGDARAMVQAVKDSTRTVLNQVPGYQEMTHGYSVASDLIDQIDRDLSLSSKNPGTAVRKLTTALNQNNEYRQLIVNELDKYAGKDLTGALAGYHLSQWGPRGIMGPASGIGLISAIVTHALSPQAALAVSMASPRLMGELMAFLNKVRPEGLGVTGTPSGRLPIRGTKAAPPGGLPPAPTGPAPQGPPPAPTPFGLTPPPGPVPQPTVGLPELPPAQPFDLQAPAGPRSSMPPMPQSEAAPAMPPVTVEPPRLQQVGPRQFVASDLNYEAPATSSPVQATPAANGPAPGMVRLYRVGATENTGANLPEWLKGSSTQEAGGRWWTQNREIADWYARPEQSGPNAPRFFVDVPQEVATQNLAINHPEASRFTKDPQNEVFLPREWVAKAQRDVATPSAPPPSVASADPNRPIVYLPTDSIKSDPARFQFKSNVGQKGVGDELKGVQVWDPVKAGTIAVWRDPADGQTYVINGHHRLELAQRTNTPEVAAIPVDAANAKEARGTGALINISEGRGTAIDAAKVFRDLGIGPAQLEERGVSLRGPVSRDALALSNLPQDLFDQVWKGQIKPSRAAIVGEMLQDRPADQRAVLDLVKKAESRGKRPTDDEIREIISLQAGQPRVTETNETLFGTEEVERSALMERAEISDYIRKRLSSDKKLFGTVGEEGRAGQLSEAGNVIQTGENAKIANQLAQAQQIYDKLKAKTGPVNDILSDAAYRMAKGEDANGVKQQAYQRIREAVTSILQPREPGSVLSGSAGPGTPGVRPAGASGSSPIAPGWAVRPQLGSGAVVTASPQSSADEIARPTIEAALAKGGAVSSPVQMAKGGVVAGSGDLIRGSWDLPLSAKGIEGTSELGKAFARKGGINRITAGNLTRTRQTAQILKNFNPRASVGLTGALQGWHLGGLEARRRDQVTRQMQNYIRNKPDVVPPGIASVSTATGESYRRFGQRVLPVVRAAQTAFLRHPNSIDVIACGDSVIAWLHGWVKAGMPADGSADPAAVLAEKPHDGVWRFAPHKGGKWAIDPIDMNAPGRLKPGLVFVAHGDTAANTSSNQVVDAA